MDGRTDRLTHRRTHRFSIEKNPILLYIERLIKTYDYDHVVFCNNVYCLQINKVIKGASRASRPLILAKKWGYTKLS